jgi:hypothetical protein
MFRIVDADDKDATGGRLAASPKSELSERETEVIQLLARGYPIKASPRRSMSLSALSRHTALARWKRLACRVEVVRFAAERGRLTPSSSKKSGNKT